LDRHAGYLFGVAASMVGNAADAEDVVQETLLGAFRGLRGFEGRSSVKTWLTSILIRQTAMRRRSAGRRLAASLESVPEAESGPSASPPTEATDTRIDMMAAIQELSPDHREVIVLREINGLSYEEMAEALGVPRGTIESRLFRARRQLQERLEGYLV
jgi:RNA polymerase sigma-70 factor (ECF subfamily)